MTSTKRANVWTHAPPSSP